MRSTVKILVAALALSGCVTTVTPRTTPAPTPQEPPRAQTSEQARQQVLNFIEVVERVEPVAEAVCREEQPRLNCDFEILVDRNPQAGINAFQTRGRNGEPLIIFTVGLVAVAQNTDELAFIMGHEAGHHIALHLDQRQASAAQGAQVFGQIARAGGADPRLVGAASQLGSLVASRQFSQSAELEADAIGTLIALRAGYNPRVGARFFSRIPDPRAGILATHPPNAQREQVVRDTMRRLGR